ncbi:MAG: hypothetical protein ACYDC3_10690, partial [Candidatus Binataceae bacterium]
FAALAPETRAKIDATLAARGSDYGTAWAKLAMRGIAVSLEALKRYARELVRERKQEQEKHRAASMAKASRRLLLRAERDRKAERS